MKKMVHFKVDYEGLTKLIRNFWAEGNYTIAIAIMTDSSIPIDMAHDVIRGKLKMVKNPANEDEGMLEYDDWKPEPGFCFMGRYPDPLDHKWFKLVNRYGTEGIPKLRNQAESACRDMNDSTYSLDKIQILNIAKEVPQEIYEYFNLPDPKTIHTGELYPVEFLNPQDYSGWEAASQLRAERLNPIPGIPDVEDYVKRQLELDKMPKPKPDKDFNRPLGYIIPTGKFYSCEWMEHEWLASVIGNSAGFNKDMATKMGWIEITHPLNEPRNFQIIYGDKEPTQKQLDTIFDWQQKYGQATIIE